MNTKTHTAMCDIRLGFSHMYKDIGEFKHIPYRNRDDEMKAMLKLIKLLNTRATKVLKQLEQFREDNTQ